MRVLIIGAGGREHAIQHALIQSSRVDQIFVWPGNDGMDVSVLRAPSELSQTELVSWAKTQKIGLVIVGPELELVLGYADAFRNAGISVFGPSQLAARLEGSKTFAKEFMLKYKIPTADADVVRSVQEVMAVLHKFTKPYVLKADGLAAGKGVYVCQNKDELLQAANEIFVEKKFGTAGETALLEQFLPGLEVSALALTDGKDFSIMPYCRDHKRLLDGDLGPNTGGMGVVGPIKIDPQTEKWITEKILKPTVNGIRNEKWLYRGVLFVGIMLTEKGPMVLEYNVRFGDPETQVLMQLLDGDWGQTFSDVADGKMPQLQWSNESAACVVLAAAGYPDAPKKGVKISGQLDSDENVFIFHAGSKKMGEEFVTNGGRVLNIVARGPSLMQSLEKIYEKISKIHWPGMQYRRDIGHSLK